MNPKIKAALDNVERHESKAQVFMTKLAEAKGLVIPIALTGGIAALGAAIPSITDSISSFTDLIKTSVENLGVLRESEPKIFYGLVAGLVAGGSLLGGVGFMERRDEKRKNRIANEQDALTNFQNAWEDIVRTNKAITTKVAHQQMWAMNAIKSNPETNGILRRNGINPQDKQALLDLRRAFIHGVMTAVVAAREDGKHAEISGATFDQFTHKHIVRGMMNCYKDLGYSAADARKIASGGYSATRELQAFQGFDVAPITPHQRRASEEDGPSR